MADGIQYNFGDVFLGAMQAQQEYNLKKQQYDEALEQQNAENVYRALNLQRQQEATAAQIRHNQAQEKYDMDKLALDTSSKAQTEKDKELTRLNTIRGKFVPMSEVPEQYRKGIKSYQPAEINTLYGQNIYDVNNVKEPLVSADWEKTQNVKFRGQEVGISAHKEAREAKKQASDQQKGMETSSLFSYLKEYDASDEEGQSKLAPRLGFVAEGAIRKAGLDGIVNVIYSSPNPAQKFDEIMNDADVPQADKDLLKAHYRALKISQDKRIK